MALATDLVAPLLAAVIGAVSTGGVSLYIFWRQTRSPARQRRVRDVWQKQAQELDERLSRQYERQIAFLEAELRRVDRGGHDGD